MFEEVKANVTSVLQITKRPSFRRKRDRFHSIVVRHTKTFTIKQAGRKGVVSLTTGWSSEYQGKGRKMWSLHQKWGDIFIQTYVKLRKLMSIFHISRETILFGKHIRIWTYSTCAVRILNCYNLVRIRFINMNCLLFVCSEAIQSFIPPRWNLLQINYLTWKHIPLYLGIFKSLATIWMAKVFLVEMQGRQRDSGGDRQS